MVLPLTREWIKMVLSGLLAFSKAVLPLTREWIEITDERQILLSRPFSLLRGSGLKCELNRDGVNKIVVLPLTREWIEIRGL